MDWFARFVKVVLGCKPRHKPLGSVAFMVKQIVLPFQMVGLPFFRLPTSSL